LLEHLPALQQLLHRLTGCQVPRQIVSIFVSVRRAIVETPHKNL
jgi:hypothetical protein